MRSTRPRARPFASRMAFAAIAVLMAASIASASASDGVADGEEFGIPSPGVLDQLMEHGAAVAQFECQITEGVLYGTIDMGNGSGRAHAVSITITENGTALINGTAITPNETSPKVLGRSDPLDSAVYSMPEVRRAITGTYSEAPAAGLTGDEARQLQGFGGFLDGLMDDVTKGSDRRMFVMLGQNSVGFFDLASGNRISNAKTASCYRVM